MQNKKLLNISEGIGTIILGILLAAFGGQTVLDTYFGVLFIFAGAAFLCFTIISLVKTGVLLFAPTFITVVGIILGSFILANYYSFGYFVYTIVLILIALGFALAFYGVYTIVRFSIFYGIGQIVAGALLAVLAFCYIFIPEFYQAFWIIVGIVVAIYGAFFLIVSIIDAAETRKEVKEVIEAEIEEKKEEDK